MPDAHKPLQHHDLDRKNEETLQQEARAHLARVPALQLVAELLIELRTLDVPWWTPSDLRSSWSAASRMAWLKERADVRQRITTTLTGFHPNAARKTPPDAQAAMIDSVIDQGDVTVKAFDAAFDPADLVVYGPVAELWRQFRERAVWDRDVRAGQQLLGWLIEALIADRSAIDGINRKPILSALDVRAAIGGKLWQKRIPLELRAAIDDARIQQERSRAGQPFLTRHELAIVTPELLAEHIPATELIVVLDAAEQAMGFARSAPSIGEASETGPSSGAEIAGATVTAFAGPTASIVSGTPPRPANESQVEWIPAPPILPESEMLEALPPPDAWSRPASTPPPAPPPAPKLTAAYYAPSRTSTPPPLPKPRAAKA